MGKHFGELAKLRGIIQFRISPHEQRAFAGAISQGIPNIFRRIWSEAFYVAVRKYNVLIFNSEVLSSIYSSIMRIN